MTGRNTEFNDIRLNDSNRSLKRRETTTLVKGSLQNLKKSSQFYNGKFTEMTSGDAEFSGQFNQIRLTIQIEV